MINMESQIKASIVMKAMDILGNIIQTHLVRPDYSKVRQLQEEYYSKLQELAKKKKEMREEKHEEIKEEHKERYREREKAKGTFCLSCSKDHFSTVSAALNEAIRFARSEGIKHDEVIRRIGIAIDELNIMERIDLATDSITKLSEREKELAEWALQKSRELRHAIDDIKTFEDLEKVAAMAAEVRTEYLKKLFNLEEVNVEEIIDKVCGELKEEEREKCREAIRSFFKTELKEEKHENRE